MQLNGSIMKCECGCDLFRVTRQLDKTYAIVYTIERTICSECGSLFMEVEREGEFV